MLRRAIETSIDINASPEAVWGVLADGAAYPQWNPFLTSLEGKLEVGESLAVTAAPPGKSAATFKPKLITVSPGQELRWRGSLPIPGLFSGEHYFRIEPTGSGTDNSSSSGSAAKSCRFVHGEQFSGLLIAVLGGMLDATEQGFHAMNKALKQRAEGGSKATA